MASFVLTNADAVLVDYDDRTAQAGFVLNGGTLALDFGRWNTSGVELDRNNLLLLFTDKDASTGINPALQFHLDAFPQVTAGSSETITLTLSLRRGAISATDTTWDRETSLSMQVNVKTNATGNQIVLSAVPTSTTYKVTALLNPAYSSIDKWNFSFTENDVLGVVETVNGHAVLEIYPLSFIAKLDSLAALYVAVIKQSADNMLDAQDYYIEIGGLPLNTESGQSISTLGITVPIDDRATANQAPQLQLVSDQALQAGVSKSITLSAPDPDNGDTVTYHVMDDASTGKIAVAFNGDAMILTPAADYAPTGPVQLTIKASDSAGAYTTQTLSISVTPAYTAKIVVSDASGEPIAGVVLATLPSNTAGEILLSAQTSSALTLMPATPAAFAAANAKAVDLQDAILILKMIVGLFTPSAVQTLAADFNANGTVDLNDAIGVLKHVVGLDSPDPTWVFVDTAWSSDAALSVGTLDDLTYTLQPGANTIELVGVLRGDVNASWVAPSENG